jgi:hypothetical protein
MAKDKRDRNKAIVNQLSRVNVQQVFAARFGQPLARTTNNALATKATHKEVLQTGLALVAIAAEQNISREQELALTRRFVGMIRNSEVPDLINQLPNELREVLEQRD